MQDSIPFTNLLTEIVNYLDRTKQNLIQQAAVPGIYEQPIVITLDNIQKGGVQGISLPIVVDNWTLRCLCADSIIAIRREYYRAEQATAKLKELKSTITHIAARI
jgi:hypothetical protein